MIFSRAYCFIFSLITHSRKVRIPCTLIILLLLVACSSREQAPDASTTPIPSVDTIPTVSASPELAASTAVGDMSTPTPAPAPTAEPEPAPIPVVISANVPAALRQPLENALTEMGEAGDGRPVHIAAVVSDVVNTIGFVPRQDVQGLLLAERVYAVVAPFDTVRDDISLQELQWRWSGQGEAPLLVSEDGAVSLGPIFGSLPANMVTESDLSGQLRQQDGALGLLAFDRLDPTYKVISVDGISPLSNQLDPMAYPIAVALRLAGADAELLRTPLSGVIPYTNRDPDRLTTLIMTGVTAMSRGTAEKMEEKGYLYPSLVISDTLSAADITHVSNEVPFVAGCKADNSFMNLTLCSDYPYWQTLQAIGTDIVGLSGNHVNDFGREGARESLAFYKENDIPIYGSGMSEDEACQPLLWEHNGNTFAFIAALAWWPEEAWATETEPGACYLYNNYDDILANVRKLSDEVDIVSVELQYWETYDPWPIEDQVLDFRDLRAAGADIVTGVQSHVPQAIEPYGLGAQGGAGTIVYGLGNLFFDQMEDWSTRTGLIALHTLYDGSVLNTGILTTVLEDYAQPRWTTLEERAGILESIFATAPPPGALSPEPTPSPAPPPLVENDQGEPAELEATPAQTSDAGADTITVPVSETASAGTSGLQAHPGLPWPTPVEQAEGHYWLAPPVGAEANRIPAATYAFGSTANGTYRMHHGSDIANPMHTALLAPDAATVVYAGPDDEAHVFGPYPGFYGNVILFQLDRAWRDQPVYVLYGHLQDVMVGSGQHVERGERVGGTGMAGIAIGPHVHVEVRLGGTGYDDTYNADLWLEPPYGYGTIAGQVVTPDGRAWHNSRLHLYRLGEQGSRLFRIIPTYAEDPGLNPDPDRAENFVFANIPAGEYQIILRRGRQNLRQRLTVLSGQTTSVNYVLQE